LKLLLDTHTLLWWAAGDETLSPKARDAILDESNTIFVSAASAWEIATKHRLGKLPQAAPIVADIATAIADEGFLDLPISVQHGQASGALPPIHRDPFDRMLAAQALTESMALVSNDRVFDAYGAVRLW
jgi:PIN domain nuclease of toxin-antitoxin system